MNWSKTKQQLENLTGREFGDTPRWADLTEANLTWADLTGADLTGANLTWANLSGANLTWADLRGANMAGADLTGADLRKANLRGANMAGADLTEADLSGANLTWADLRGANMAGADLTGADLQFTGLFAFAAGRHFGFYVPWQRYLKIGCIGESLDWWLENYEAAGAKNDYSEMDIARYGSIIRMIAELYQAEVR